jgi:TolA-binding protein
VQEKDFLLAFLSSTAVFYKKHKSAVWVGVLILLVAGLVGYATVAHQKKVTEESWAAYYQAQVALITNGEADGFFKLDELQQKYPNTPAALYGQLFKGDFLYSRENFAQAADVYRPLLTAKNETVRTDAALSLAASLQATNDYKDSVEVISDFITHQPKSFALPQAYFTLAMSQELGGHKQEAIDAYQLLVTTYPNSYFGKVAKDKLADLQK